MKKWIIFSVIVIVLVITTLVIVTNSSGVQSNPKNSTIVAFGDSLVYGYGSTKGNDFVSQLSRDVGVSIENFGKNGDTTQSALSRIDTILARDPGIVILVLGGNDILRRIPMTETDKNIRAIIESLQQNDTRVILVGVQGALLNDPYESMYSQIAQDTQVKYVSNILRGLIGRSEYMSDAIHPNDAGYARIAERIRDPLESLLKR